MSKDFDTTLSDALDNAAHAVHTAGPEAARIRGRQRTMRKRIAVSTVSLALVAIGATAAFKAESNPGGTPHQTTVTPSATASSNRTPTVNTTPSPSLSGPTPSGPASSSPPASSQSTTADPHHVINAAWLNPGQLPFADTFRWAAQPATGQPLTATVFYLANNTSLQALTVCGDPANLLSRTIGAQGTQYLAPPTGSGNAASQFVFFFADAASAQQAFAWLQGQYGAACLPGTGVTSTKTAGDGQTSAVWLTRKTTSGPIDMAPYNREYFVLRGNTIGYVSISSKSNLPTAYDDAAQLSTIASHLCVYGGPCN